MPAVKDEAWVFTARLSPGDRARLERARRLLGLRSWSEVFRLLLDMLERGEVPTHGNGSTDMKS